MRDDADLQILLNPRPDHGPGPAFLGPTATEAVRRVHEALPEYRQTPLVPLPELAKALGVGAVYIKDESSRFGLKAFKGLGGSYALFCLVCERLGLDKATTSFADLQSPALAEAVRGLTFVTATDGNHGKGVAWTAAKLGCPAYVYMPKGSSPQRVQAIREVTLGRVTVTDWGYDDTVRHAAETAARNGWLLVQDTSWPGYEDIPRTIVQGYLTLAREAAEQLEAEGLSPTHVFLQAGVGSMAGGVLGYLRTRYVGRPVVAAVVEPKEMACFFRSAAVGDGEPHPATGSGETIMAGLNCGEPCTLVWPILRDQADAYFTCTDRVTVRGMRLLARSGLVSGESGAVTAGLAAFLAREAYSAMKTALRLDESSVLLLFSTEGDTDPLSYQAILSGDGDAE